MTSSLEGLRVGIARASQQSELVQLLRAEEAIVVDLPVVEIVAPRDGGAALKAATARIADYEWVVFTSANAVHAFLEASGVASSASFAAVGRSTAEAMRVAGIEPSLVADPQTAQGLVESFPNGTGSVLFPRSAIAADTVVEGLTAKGWRVDAVDAYDAVERSDVRIEVALDVVVFTSSSTVRALLKCEISMPQTVVCIGPSTARAAEIEGVVVSVTAGEPSASGLVKAIKTALLA